VRRLCKIVHLSWGGSRHGFGVGDEGGSVTQIGGSRLISGWPRKTSKHSSANLTSMDRSLRRSFSSRCPIRQRTECRFAYFDGSMSHTPVDFNTNDFVESFIASSLHDHWISSHWIGRDRVSASSAGDDGTGAKGIRPLADLRDAWAEHELHERGPPVTYYQVPI
jgi:hypothetical protein